MLEKSASCGYNKYVLFCDGLPTGLGGRLCILEYPKVTSESEGEVEIDFTDTEKPEETPPPVPEGKTEIEDPGEEHEVNPDPAVPEITAPPAEESTSSNEPAPGSSNGSGAVYDPVFGWVVPGDVQQSTGDSDGDLNKQVGNMGG